MGIVELLRLALRTQPRFSKILDGRGDVRKQHCKEARK